MGIIIWLKHLENYQLYNISWNFWEIQILHIVLYYSDIIMKITIFFQINIFSIASLKWLKIPL